MDSYYIYELGLMIFQEASQLTQTKYDKHKIIYGICLIDCLSYWWFDVILWTMIIILSVSSSIG